MSTVLIIDDSPTEVHVLKTWLEKNGFSTITAESGEEGIEMAKAEKPDAIIMDVVMPGMSGFQATRQLSKDPDTSRIPVVMVTTKDQERLALTFARDLERAGIAARVRLVDAVQFEQRRQTFDFDMIPFEWQQSLSPGNEQSFYWGSAAADAPGSRNYMGVRSAAIDALIAAMLDARSREDLVAAVRALDRVLISGFYVVPLFHLPAQWVARWTRIAHPQRTSNSGYLPETWWHQPPAP